MCYAATGLEGNTGFVAFAANSWPAGVSGPSVPCLSPSAAAASPKDAQQPRLSVGGEAAADTSPAAAGTYPAPIPPAAPTSAWTARAVAKCAAGAVVKRAATRRTSKRKAAPAAAEVLTLAAAPAGADTRAEQAQQRSAHSTKRRSSASKAAAEEDRELVEMQEHVSREGWVAGQAG
jgi:Tfp pilus assembly protein PilV